MRARVLPRVKLSDGSELRVLQVGYGTEAEDHHFGTGAKELFWIWRHLPKQIQRVLPYPDYGASGEMPSPPHTAISIWCGWFQPGASRQPILGPAEAAVVTFDSGEQKNLDAIAIDDYRQILIIDPPNDSKRLRLQFPLIGSRDRRYSRSGIPPTRKRVEAPHAVSREGVGNVRPR